MISIIEISKKNLEEDDISKGKLYLVDLAGSEK